jgi:parvulin-like peptidyl-prolyl isomerase
MRRGSLLPAVEELVDGLAVGAVSKPVPVKGGFAVLRVEDVRYPENPALREQAEYQSRTRRRTDAVWQAFVGLQQKYLKKLDRALLERVDFHARKPGMAALLKDKRVVVSFKDRAEKPITVGDVADAVQKKFFHGADLAIKEKRVNDHKEKVFDTMLMKRILMKEAKARGIHESVAFRSQVEQHENTVVFGRFVETAIRPSVRVEETAVKAYYEAHKDDFTNPELVTLDSIAFPDVAKAQVALDKLRAGADFDWMRVNGDGILSEEEQDQELKGRTITTDSMPAALAKALSAAREGEYRLYSTAGRCYVLKVARRSPAAVRPMEAVKTEIIKKLFEENLVKAVKDWAAKVREVTPVEVFITRLEH